MPFEVFQRPPWPPASDGEYDPAGCWYVEGGDGGRERTGEAMSPSRCCEAPRGRRKSENADESADFIMDDCLRWW